MENNKNIWLLPTNEPSRLHLWTDEKGKRLELCDLEYSHTRNIQHIYITSDEEIRRDDLCMDTITKWIFRATRKIKEKHNFYQKIVLADDPKLIVNGVQPIPDEFLEWFIKNPSCEEVEVKSIVNRATNIDSDIPTIPWVFYKITIPKECNHNFVAKFGEVECQNCDIQEEPKQETLEEATRKYLKNCKEAIHDNIMFIQGSNFGAKWQQEQDKKLYSEEDMINFAQWFSDYEIPKSELISFTEQFKNK